MDDKWNRLTTFIEKRDPKPDPLTDGVPTSGTHACPEPANGEIRRRLDLTQELACIGDWEYEVATGKTVWSRHIFRLLERAPLSGHLTFEEFLFNYSTDDSAQLQTALEKSIRNNERCEMEVTAHLLGGSTARHRIIFIPSADQKGVVSRVNCFLQDSTRLKLETFPGMIPRHYQRFVAVNTSDVVFRVSLPDSAFEFISPAVRDITGRDPREWYRNPLVIREILHPGWKGKFDREFKKMILGRAGKCYVFPILRASGEVRWIQLRTTLLRDPHGELLAIEGIASDITDRKRQEGERKRLIRQLRKALAEVKTLSGLLPICSHCKKVRDDQGYWQQIDAFITEHSDLFFSHGLCPECLTEHYPEFASRRHTR